MGEPGCNPQVSVEDEETYAAMAERYGRRAVVAEAENARLRAEKAAAESTGWRREDQLLGRIQVLEAANYQLQAEVARLRSALSEINQVPHRSATPLKRMRIMWDLAANALSNEGGDDE
jgi:hypothetical protein